MYILDSARAWPRHGKGGYPTSHGITVTPERSSNDDRRVVPFRRPGAPRWPVTARPRGGPGGPGGPVRGPVPDLTKYERADTGDDYRHRMTMNALGFLVTVLLILAGVWLVDKIAELRKVQDCYLTGRRDCAPIEVPPSRRD